MAAPRRPPLRTFDSKRATAPAIEMTHCCRLRQPRTGTQNIVPERLLTRPIDGYFRFTTGWAACQSAPEDPPIISQVPSPETPDRPIPSRSPDRPEGSSEPSPKPAARNSSHCTSRRGSSRRRPERPSLDRSDVSATHPCDTSLDAPLHPYVHPYNETEIADTRNHYPDSTPPRDQHFGTGWC
jgi:hypothetical protein